jgi:hypothetical protein
MTQEAHQSDQWPVRRADHDPSGHIIVVDYKATAKTGEVPIDAECATSIVRCLILRDERTRRGQAATSHFDP